MKRDPYSSLCTNPEICLGEANLVWDEYKYRHDPIWRHLIKSTIAVIALITIAYSDNYESLKILFIIAALLAVIYTIFSYIILDCELILFDKIKIFVNGGALPNKNGEYQS